MKPGFRIIKEIARLEQQLIDSFTGIPSSNISDVMYRFFSMRAEIRPYSIYPMLGSAFTLRVPSSDNLLIHYALDLAKPGDVLVIATDGDSNRALMGEIMFTYAKTKQLSGVVIDGAIRDVDCLVGLELPVYAKAVSLMGPYKNGPGEINFPVSCGGQVVHPGDLIVGDQDGVVVVPKADAEIVLALAQEKFREECELLQNYRAGDIAAEEHHRSYEALVTEKLKMRY
jgi:RraA family protein